MPFKSDAQRKLMYAVANNPAVAKKTSISKAVADKFIAHKAQGGAMATKMPKEGSAAYKAQERKHVNAMKKAGVDPKIVAEEKREAGLKKGGGVKKYAIGGAPMGGGLGAAANQFNAAQSRSPMGGGQGSGFGTQQAAQQQFQASPQFQSQQFQSPGISPGSVQGSSFGAQQAAQLAAQQRMQAPQMTAPSPQYQSLDAAAARAPAPTQAQIMAQNQAAQQQYAAMQNAFRNDPQKLAMLQQSMQPIPDEMARMQQMNRDFQAQQAAQLQNQPRSFGAAPQQQAARAPGRVATPAPRGRGAMMNRAEGGVTKKYAFGGMAGPGGEMSPDDMAQFAESLKKEADTRRAKQGGAGMGGSPTVGFKKGGRIDGCAVRGKTKGRFI